MPVTKRAKSVSLETLFDTLHAMVSRHAPPFKLKTGMVRNKRDLHLITPEPVAIPDAYGGKPTDKAMASIIEQKGYIGFYFTTINGDRALRKKLSPTLMKTLKGSSCFHLTQSYDSLLQEIESALQAGTKFFKVKGWL
jgi:hypothetical protein